VRIYLPVTAPDYEPASAHNAGMLLPLPSQEMPPRQNFPPSPLLRSIAELDERVGTETVLRLAQPRVVFTDYEVLQHDFPELRGDALVRAHPRLARTSGQKRLAATHQLIDDWLLHNAAFISERQAGQSRVNTSIQTTGERITAYRPPRYGRAVVIELRNAPGLLDLKGAGVAPDAEPAHRPHSHGLLSLSDALYDVMIQRIIDEILRRARTEFWSVPVYGLIDLGFEIVNRKGQRSPACIQVRRAHRRPRGAIELPASGSPEEQVKFEIEMLLRSYGLSSCGDPSSLVVTEQDGGLQVAHGKQPVDLSDEDLREIRQRLRARDGWRHYFDGINVQLTREVGVNPSRAQLVDFGHYTARWGFQHPVVSMVRDQPACWGATLWPDHPLFIHPDSRLLLPEEFHAYARPPAGRVPDCPVSRPTDDQELPLQWARELARQFHAGEVSSGEVQAQIDDMVRRATRGWPSARSAK
jgi:hypothetical protein